MIPYSDKWRWNKRRWIKYLELFLLAKAVPFRKVIDLPGHFRWMEKGLFTIRRLLSLFLFFLALLLLPLPHPPFNQFLRLETLNNILFLSLKKQIPKITGNSGIL